ncbi:MAG: kinase [Candidatus Omnitrophica bacterium]|nr:kinase [Candidatus Omnitrophota bacterium]
MIISRTPFRISFFGGGTDYPAWYKKNDGLVLSTSIDKYCYVMCRYLPPFFECNYRIRYSATELTKTVQEIRHPSIRECILFLDIKRGLEIQHNADLPAMSGLGSSSSFSVGLLHCLYALIGKMVTNRQLAFDAIHVEQERIKENVGSQDQTIAAFGGFNKIVFSAQQTIAVHPIIINEDKLSQLQQHLMLFFIGFPRNASDIAKEQIANIPKKEKELTSMMKITEMAIDALCSETDGLDVFGRLLNEAWQVKKSLAANITNNYINEIYENALDAGALGGKLLGAGSGGFVLIFARPKDQPKIRERLKKLLFVPFNFETLGSQIIYYSHDDYAKDVI